MFVNQQDYAKITGMFLMKPGGKMWTGVTKETLHIHIQIKRRMLDFNVKLKK